MFSRFFKKRTKELQEVLKLEYDEKNIYIRVDIESLNQDTRNFFELIVDELEEEQLIIFNQNTIQIKYENVYKTDMLNMFLNIQEFRGSLEVELQGLIQQDNAVFLLNLFDERYNQIAPYKIYGAILEITKNNFYLLPQNIFKIFQAYNNIDNDLHKYQFIELIQNDNSNKVKFNGFMEHDRVKTVDTIGLNIKEDQFHNLILSPQIDGLDETKIQQYKNVIDKAKKNLLLTDTAKEKITRYLLDDTKIKLAQTINKKSFVPKEKAGIFLANPSIHFEDIDEDIQDELVEQVLNKGFRIIGIGEPYVGYFGSVKIDTPLSDVLKMDESFKVVVDQNEINEFVKQHENNLEDIQTQIQTAKEKGVDEVTIEDRKIFKPAFDKYLSKIESVLVIKPNDEIEDIQLQTKISKSLEEISINDTKEYQNYIDFQFTPLVHQVIALNWMIDLYKNNYRGCLLADDMGLGKTFEVISFLNFLKRKKKNIKVLIVAPTVLIENWQNEFQKSLKNNNFRIKILRGKNKVLDKLNHLVVGDILVDELVIDLEVINFLEDYDVYITTYKTLQKYQFAWVSEMMKLDCIVYDEAQNIKNPNTLQTQASKAISSQDGVFNILMTGTPIENELRDLWSLFDTFDPAFFGSWKHFRKEYITNSDNAEKRLREKISNYMLRRMKNDILDGLPKKYEQKYEVIFTQTEAQNYFDLLHNDKPPLAKLRDLRLYSMHPILLQKEKLTNVSALVEDNILNNFSKTEKLLSLLKGIEKKGEKVIVFAISKNIQIILQYTLKRFFNLSEVHIINGDNNKSNTMATKLDNFKNKSGFNIIILSPIAVGVGLTLVEANHVIHFERHYNPAKENQASDRVYRIGQEKDVYIYHLISKLPLEYKKVTFDEGLSLLIENKQALSSGTLIPTNKIEDKEMIEMGVI